VQTSDTKFFVHANENSLKIQILCMALEC